MVETSILEAKIRSRLKDVAHLQIRDLTGTQDHFEAVVVSDDFSGKSRVEQHQMIYQALGELMSGPVHALALTTYDSAGWKKKQGAK